jgi:hypothetical protein
LISSNLFSVLACAAKVSLSPGESSGVTPYTLPNPPLAIIYAVD